jgi:DNA-binding NtrC family response regulator
MDDELTHIKVMVVEDDPVEAMIRFHAAGSPCSVIMHAGAFYYATKPFEPHQLSAMVESAVRDPDTLVPLTEAKRRASSEFERRYLVRVMEKAKGSVSEAARLAGLDRTNFRRLLQKHGLESTKFKS